MKIINLTELGHFLITNTLRKGGIKNQCKGYSSDKSTFIDEKNQITPIKQKIKKRMEERLSFTRKNNNLTLYKVQRVDSTFRKDILTIIYYYRESSFMPCMETRTLG